MSLYSEFKQIKKESEKPGGEKNVLDFLIYRNLSTVLLYIIRDVRVSPNYITALSVCFSIITSCFLFSSHTQAMLSIGLTLMMFSLVLDTLDGQYSRYTQQQSEFGGWFDGVSDCLKYLFILGGIILGLFYHYDQYNHWYINDLVILNTYREFILILGLWIFGNLFMVYYIHVSRYKLSINFGTVVNLSGSRKKFFFGIESTLYTIFFVFLIVGQPLWLLVFLSLSLPVLWVYPFYLVFRKSKDQSDH